MTAEIFSRRRFCFVQKLRKRLWSTVYFFISGMKIQKYSYGIFLDRFIDIFYQQRLRLYQSDAGVDGLLRNLPFAIHRCLDSGDQYFGCSAYSSFYGSDAPIHGAIVSRTLGVRLVPVQRQKDSLDAVCLFDNRICGRLACAQT